MPHNNRIFRKLEEHDLRCLNRLIAPDEGTVCFRGDDISRFEETAIRRNIVPVGQTSSVFPGSVLDNPEWPFSFAEFKVSWQS